METKGLACDIKTILQAPSMFMKYKQDNDKQ